MNPFKTYKQYMRHRRQVRRAHRAYNEQRSYFRTKTQGYINALSMQGSLRALPSEHKAKVLDFWHPILSLSLSQGYSAIGFK